MSKAKAVAGFAQNITFLQKIPKMIEEAIANFKAQYEEVMEVIEDLKQG